MLRQRYRGGEKVFVDYAGPRFEVVDQESAEVREVMVFVGILAASNYTFVRGHRFTGPGSQDRRAAGR